MSENINKVWGTRRRIHLDEKNEIDLLHLKANTFCSTHKHKTKINKFVVVQGCVRIETEFGHGYLNPTDTWVVRPPLKHRFYAVKDSIMIEMAYVEEGQIDPNDIDREFQGGRMVEGREMTLDEMRKKGLLDL